MEMNNTSHTQGNIIYHMHAPSICMHGYDADPSLYYREARLVIIYRMHTSVSYTSNLQSLLECQKYEHEVDRR